MKITIDDVYNDLSNTDAYCSYYRKTKDEIVFDNDESGNAKKGYYFLKFYKDKCKISRGQLLKSHEKRSFYFKDYTSVEELTNDIVEFNKKYFKSFHIIRK